MKKKKPGRPAKDITRSKQAHTMIVHIMMYEDEHEKIKAEADELGISVSTFMMLAARDYLYKK